MTMRPQRERLPWEFNGVVRLTKVGTTYIVTTVVIAVAAINTGNNSLYIAVSFMLASLLLSGIASKSGLKHLEVEISRIGDAWAEAPADGTLRIRNRSRVWNVRDVVLTSDAFAAPLFVPLIGRRDELTIPVVFRFRQRGMAQITAIDSYTRYPFAFFLKKKRLPVNSEVVVFPKLGDFDGSPERFRAVVGEQTTSGKRGHGIEVHSFRDYVHGDSLRQVHWKKSASVGRWIIRQTEEDAARSVHVTVDAYKPEAATDDEFEQMISAAATFIFDATRRGLDVTLTLPRMTVRVRESEVAAPLFHALALVEPERHPADTAEYDSVVFSMTGGHGDAKSA